jgi:hypothetical protein
MSPSIIPGFAEADIFFERLRTKRRFRVRLNGADHQWGKDPLKEVVG